MFTGVGLAALVGITLGMAFAAECASRVRTLSIISSPVAMSEEDKARAIAEGDAQIAAGQTVPRADVVRWLESWGKPDELPPPPWK